MNYLYLLLNIGSLSIPFLFSFHPKLKFYKLWKPLFIAVSFTMLVFIPWDIIFTNQGVWGFNDHYFLGIKLFQLPIEEWLFFICIPYACAFTHYALWHYFPKMVLSISATKGISYSLVFILVILCVTNYDKWYTFINFLLAVVLISLVNTKNIHLLSRFYITFLIMLIPFFVVNGILTGSFIENEVVWYNNTENLNIRLLTIPIEDIIYAFSMILMNLFILELFKKKETQL
jgi:lycopene cyclase domain-containing protein